MSISKFSQLLLVSASVAASSCATIVGSPTQTIPISSTPSEAAISIKDENGVEVFKGTTPTTVTLPKHAGGYWAKKSFTVTIARDGFKPYAIPVTASANGWYILGNFVFGGAIGWFAVDPFNGNMYTLSPANISAGMSKETAQTTGSENTSISVMLLQDVPSPLKEKLVRLN